MESEVLCDSKSWCDVPMPSRFVSVIERGCVAVCSLSPTTTKGIFATASYDELSTTVSADSTKKKNEKGVPKVEGESLAAAIKKLAKPNTFLSEVT